MQSELHTYNRSKIEYISDESFLIFNTISIQAMISCNISGLCDLAPETQEIYIYLVFDHSLVSKICFVSR